MFMRLRGLHCHVCLRCTRECVWPWEWGMHLESTLAGRAQILPAAHTLTRPTPQQGNDRTTGYPCNHREMDASVSPAAPLADAAALLALAAATRLPWRH